MAETSSRSGPVPVQSVGRSLDLLEAVASEELGLVALAERAGLTPSTAHRLLATLEERGYVTRSDRTGRYRIGHKFTEVSAVAARHSERIRSAVRPHLLALRDASHETANLVVLDGLSVVYVDQVESARAVRMFTTIGRRVPLHACAGGKAIMAFGPPALLDQLAERGLPRLTPHTLTARRAVAAELEATRERGFALDNEEYEEGVVCVAAPILGPSGEAMAAASVSGPSVRMRERDLDELGALVREETRSASRELGAMPEAPAA